ncbi:MAG: hypothetical protein EZS28_038565 [Streblomastix strix]|uniref:Uncharacterized protein n=1 Tax=Streblomastix strix TaxID=222440 RepID=A0A5J4U6F0_9EUKA|nr:MAG: hypothetical protein EZS28_038565 [Streblomastix strix]
MEQLEVNLKFQIKLQLPVMTSLQAVDCITLVLKVKKMMLNQKMMIMKAKTLNMLAVFLMMAIISFIVVIMLQVFDQTYYGEVVFDEVPTDLGDAILIALCLGVCCCELLSGGICANIQYPGHSLYLLLTDEMFGF